jgi:hypothetical protein
MALNTQKLDDAVAAFKKVCDPHSQLYQYGQFYVTRLTIDVLLGQIETDLKSNMRFQLFPDKVKPVMDFFRAKLMKVSVPNVDVPVIMAMLDGLDNNGDMAAIKAMFKPRKDDRASAQSAFDTLWSSKDLPTGPPYVAFASLQMAQAAFEIENDKCWHVLREFARMLLKKRAIGPLPPAARLSNYKLAGAFLKDISPQRQEVVYPSQPDLTAAVTKMKAVIDNFEMPVIDAGGYVHCGLLSGATHNRSKFPQPEHHILVFAYDTVEGEDRFLFWDPDAARSDIVSTRKNPDDPKTGWGPGFGLLFSRTGRLCTGIDDVDLAGLDLDPKSEFFGDHNTREPRRHCYQVYTVQSLPLPAAVKVHMKVLSAPAHSSIDDMLDRAVRLYAAHGVELHEASREVIEPGSDLDRYQTLFVGDGDAGPSDEVTALHKALRDRREAFGVEPPASDAVVAFVGDLVPAARGSALSPPDQPGIVLSAAAAGDWTLAHEIGRLAGLEVVAEPGRLMSASNAGLDDPQLTDEEARTVLDSPLAQA